MRDISGKQITLRTASASACVFFSAETLEMIREERLPKGNLFDVARAAGFIGAKMTPQLLPHCHPVQIDGMDLKFEFLSEVTGIQIIGTAKSIGRTGIEMEVLTAVSVAALEIYDMLKPVDKSLEIGNIKLLEKKGGKSDRVQYLSAHPVCAVLVCSDSTAEGTRQDQSGLLIQKMLREVNGVVEHYAVVKDSRLDIQEQIRAWVEEDVHFIFTTGGTGLGPRDQTVEAVREIIEREAEGIAEAMRSYGQQRSPVAMMSRAVAGTLRNTTIITLPGSVNGARESLEALLPVVFHARKMIEGGGH